MKRRPDPPPARGGRGRRTSGPPRRPRSGRPHPSVRTGTPPGDPARAAALELLEAVRERDAYANLTLPGILRKWDLTGRDAALATELGYGACRALGQLDAIIGRCTDRPLGELDGAVVDALRLGAYQLLHTRIPAHAAVSTTVDRVRAGPRPQAASLTNAVLRRITETDLAGWVERLAPAASTDPLARLALATAHPRWITGALADALAARPPVDEPAGRGDHVIPAGTPADLAHLAVALQANNRAAPVHLVARPGRISRDELAAQVQGRPGRYSPQAVYLPGGDPAQVPAVAAGDAAVQDEGSQLVALALAAAPLNGSDTRWLDLAAGPGGKAALLGGLAAARGARLDAVEKAPHRADLVRRATAGMPVTVHTVDGRRSGLERGSFDRVLLDAPCSGIGALRRRPESRWRRSERDLPGLIALQRELLEAASALVRPGGIIAYVTCSPHLSETIGVVHRQGGVEPIDARPHFPGVPHLGRGPTVQLWTHLHGTDAMFCALVRRV